MLTSRSSGQAAELSVPPSASLRGEYDVERKTVQYAKCKGIQGTPYLIACELSKLSPEFPSLNFPSTVPLAPFTEWLP